MVGSLTHSTMATVLNRKGLLLLSESRKAICVDLICYAFVLLFVYTAASKLLTLETFKSVLIHYPIIGTFHVFFAYAVPTIEILISVMLIYPPMRRSGLMASLILMSLFLGYIVYMFVSGSELPCSCGGFISKLSWGNHIWFNSIFILLAAVGIKLTEP